MTLACGVHVVKRPCRSRPRRYTPKDLSRIFCRVVDLYGPEEAIRAVEDAKYVCCDECQLPCELLLRAIQVAEFYEQSWESQRGFWRWAQDALFKLQNGWERLRAIFQALFGVDVPKWADVPLSDLIDFLATVRSGELRRSLCRIYDLQKCRPRSPAECAQTGGGI